MENTISFNTKFGRISATETRGKITSVQFKRLKKKGSSSINLRKLKSNINAYFEGKTNKIKISIKTVGNPMQKKIWNELKKIKKGKPKLVTTINTNLYESKIAKNLKNIQNNYTNASIGSYPYFNLAAKTGGVNIVVSSWDMKSIQPIVDDITKMIELNGGKSSIV